MARLFRRRGVWLLQMKGRGAIPPWLHNERHIWNLRGFGQRDRRRQLIEYIREQHLDFVGLQETTCSSFSQVEVDSLGGAMDFQWEWIPALGRLGGILLGLNKDSFADISFSRGELFLGAEVLQKKNNFRWELIVVYRPADHSRSLDLLQELYAKVANS